MTLLTVQTHIHAPKEVIFDLSRNIDIHIVSANQTGEQAISGTTSGLIGLGETVTWKGRHFGMILYHTSHIPILDYPDYFVDVMTKGHFKSFRHEHRFQYDKGITLMTDTLYYETPFGFFGAVFDRLVLRKYLYGFLQKRNAVLKELAEKPNQ